MKNMLPVCVCMCVCVYIYLSVPTFVTDKQCLRNSECTLSLCRTAKFHKFLFLKINNNNMTDLGTREVGVIFAAVSVWSSEDIQTLAIEKRLSTLSDEKKDGDKRICLNFWCYSDNIIATPVNYKREQDLKIVAFYGYSERLAKCVPKFRIFFGGHIK